MYTLVYRLYMYRKTAPERESEGSRRWIEAGSICFFPRPFGLGSSAAFSGVWLCMVRGQVVRRRVTCYSTRLQGLELVRLLTSLASWLMYSVQCVGSV